MKKINAIITGATGMIGEAMLHQCLEDERIGKVLSISRKPSGYKHPKLKEIIHLDLSDIAPLGASLKGYDVCFFCAGSTSLGKSEDEYTFVTYTITLNFAKVLADINSGMTFCYISGAATDSSEKGRIMWARVKGRTENDLIKLPFARVFNFRPAIMIPFLPLKPTQTYYRTYKNLKWLMVLLKPLAPNYIIVLKDLTTAMIRCALNGYEKNILEVRDIRKVAGEV